MTNKKKMKTTVSKVLGAQYLKTWGELTVPCSSSIVVIQRQRLTLVSTTRDDFDPDAIEGILSGQNESTPIFNQLFGAVDYTNDDEAAVADEDLEELEAQMAFENAPSRKRRRQKQVRLEEQ